MFYCRAPSCGAITFLILLLVSAPSHGASVAEVEKAIAGAKAYIYSQQKDGHWETVAKPVASNSGSDTKGSQWGGRTALATYALLAAGEEPQDKRLAPAIAFLKKANLTGTYALGIRCQVWLLLPQTPEVKALMKKDAGALLGLMKTKDRAKGFYDYDATGGPTTYSLSRSQYAVLGVWAAAQAGVEIPTGYWQTVEQAWLRSQDRSGGWRYQEGGRTQYPLTAGITAVGVATLYITQDYLAADAGARCRGNIRNAAIERGLNWIDKHFDQVAPKKRFPRDFPFATLYAIERIGVAGGRKQIGGRDWYQKGANYLIAEQGKDGSWYSGSGFVGKLPDTCFGLLFLTRGRAPLVMNKLEYESGGKEADWNQRPRDVANLSRWIGRVAERDLNWQVVNLRSRPADLHDAPILFMSGTKALELDDAAKARLRRYAEEGGLLLGHADCGGRAFANSFQKLGREMFPKYEFRELPADHAIYQGMFPRDKWRSKPSLLGVSNGVRELMVLIPQADVGRVWQSQVVRGKEESWQLGANIFFYAVDRQNLRYRGEKHWVVASRKKKPQKSIEIARLEYDGNWDPEPAGWRRLGNIFRNEHALALSPRPLKVDALADSEIRIAHLTGTAKFSLSDSTRKALTQFIDAGGTLIIDAAGGSDAFAASAEAEIKAILKDASLKPIALDHPVFTTGKEPLKTFGYRRLAREKLVGKLNAPRLQGVTVGKRIAIFFSREDLSAGLVGQEVDGILGYDPRTATEVMTRILRYASPSSFDETSQ